VAAPRDKALPARFAQLWAKAATWDERWVVEAFCFVNLAFLAFDIYIAHSTNHFQRVEEWIPFYFSLAGPLLLALGFVLLHKWKVQAPWRDLGHLVGWAAIAIGCAGVIFHLDSRFFYERTLKSLTYAAPFAAPLAYTGLGMLLIMNRMVQPGSLEWSKWVLLLTLGGFLGNFVLSLTDHATNGFFRTSEWIPVISSAFAVAFLLVAILMKIGRRFLWLCAAVLVLQAGVGVLGFVLHVVANLAGPSTRPLENLVNGAPPLAPLLFPNLALLGLIGLWTMSRKVSE